MTRKELFERVLPKEYIYDNYKVFTITYYADNQYRNEIDMHKVADMCKEWIVKGKYNIHMFISKNGTILELLEYRKVVKRYDKDTELEAIFKSCAYILEREKEEC